MAKKSRSELQNLFKQGAKPSGDDFKDFIESTLNIVDDGMEKPSGANTPLKITAYGKEENLLDFYAGDTKIWTINQKPGEKSGLNISTAGSSKLFIGSSSGNIGIGTTDPGASKLKIAASTSDFADVAFAEDNSGQLQIVGKNQGWNINTKTDGKHLYLNRDAGPQSNVLIGTANKELFVRGSDGNVGIGTTNPDPNFRLDVNGVVRATAFITKNPLMNRMYPSDPDMHDNIFEAKEAGAITVIGKPSYNDWENTSSNPWGLRALIQYGGKNEEDGNGAEVTIPKGYDTVWVRVLGERWNAIKAYFTDGEREQIGVWTGGMRSANCYCPDGSLSDSCDVYHQWLPIPAGRSGKLALIPKAYSEYINTEKMNLEFWLSGLAFSKNPWSHATQSALGYRSGVNGGDKTIWDKDSDNWNNDIYTRIEPKKKTILQVPVRPSKRDKLLYLVEINNYWNNNSNGCMHNGITVKAKGIEEKIERFCATYDNPFARHWNSKFSNRYIAARIPKNLIDEKDRYLTVEIDMTQQNYGISFRELGTHDMELTEF
ncbi:MAG: hypothetical protein ACFKPT_02870 [Gloeotrichia echinulata GP01]